MALLLSNCHKYLLYFSSDEISLLCAISDSSFSSSLIVLSRGLLPFLISSSTTDGFILSITLLSIESYSLTAWILSSVISILLYPSILAALSLACVSSMPRPFKISGILLNAFVIESPYSLFASVETFSYISINCCLCAVSLVAAA